MTCVMTMASTNSVGGYYRDGGVEAEDVIEAVTAGLSARDGWLLGNIIKYSIRCARKHENPDDDLSKANDYAHRLCKGMWRHEDGTKSK